MASIFNKIDLINGDNTYSTLRMSNYGSINSVLTSNGNGTSDWADIYLQKSGGTMSGNIEMNASAVKSTFTPNANNVLTNKLYVDSAVNNITLSSVGTGTALTSSTTNPNFSLKSMMVGAGLSMTSISNMITLTNSSPASGITLGSSVGTGTTLTSSTTNPNFLLKRISVGSGLGISDTSTNITLTNSSPASSITLGSSGVGYSLVNNGSSPNLTIKSISPGNNVTFTETTGNIIINSSSTSIFSGYPFNPIQFATSTIEPSTKNYYYICFMNRDTIINGIQFYSVNGQDPMRCGIYRGYISQTTGDTAVLVGQTNNDSNTTGLPYTKKDIIPVGREIFFTTGECMMIAFHTNGTKSAYYQNQPLLEGNTEIMFSGTRNYVEGEEGFKPTLDGTEIESPILTKICFELY